MTVVELGTCAHKLRNVFIARLKKTGYTRLDVTLDMDKQRIQSAQVNLHNTRMRLAESS
jgi:hypothetical protein